MTIERFMKNFGIKNKKKVISWLNNQLIPGAKKNKKTDIWNIPEDARPPYTEKRARGGQAVYISIVRGCLKGKNVFPKLYNMTPERFEVYIQELQKAKLITSFEAKGITYYEPTPITQKYSSLSDSKFKKAIEKTIEIAIKSSTSAYLDRI